ncbi:MAG: hypothetical protein IT196_21170 [Acidimicrobiales bacterium]|nr:hypothetical protein [Acidimicrobiales bacterium]
MAKEPLVLTTSDGVSIEAQLDVPDGLRAAAVLCHPHPLYGGTMFDGVPDILFGALPAQGVAALRFNFRGVGRSGGAHGEGVAERHDVLAAVAALAAAAPGVPLVLAGWSFGGDVSLAVTDPAVTAWLPIAPPLRIGGEASFAAVAADPRRKRLLVPEQDQYNPPEKASVTVAGWTATELVTVPGADHFLWGHGAFLIEAALGFIGELAS